MRLRAVALAGCCLLGVLMLLGGGGLIVAHTLLRDDAGAFDVGSQRFQSNGYAVVSGDFDTGDVAAAGVELGDVAGFTIEVGGTARRPIFAGVGPRAEVDAYLAGVAHSEVVDFDARGDPVYKQVEGGPPPGPPGEQGFWISSSEGAGTQRLDWDPTDPALTAVAMNADGSQGVGIDGEAGLEVSWLLWLGVGLAVAGLLIAVASAIGIRRARRARAEPPPTPTPGVFN